MISGSGASKAIFQDLGIARGIVVFLSTSHYETMALALNNYFACNRLARRRPISSTLSAPTSWNGVSRARAQHACILRVVSISHQQFLVHLHRHLF